MVKRVNSHGQLDGPSISDSQASFVNMRGSIATIVNCQRLLESLASDGEAAVAEYTTDMSLRFVQQQKPLRAQNKSRLLTAS
jgi:hypothetical protein